MSAADFHVPKLSWPEFMAGMDPASRVFSLALSISIVLHAVLFSLHFKFPDATRLKNTPQMLEVVLVNSKTKSKPVNTELHAQSNLDGGGNTDQNRRASTPLPVMSETERGSDVTRATKKVQELEAQQQRLLTQLQAKTAVASTEPKSEPKQVVAPESKQVVAPESKSEPKQVVVTESETESEQDAVAAPTLVSLHISEADIEAVKAFLAEKEISHV